MASVFGLQMLQMETKSLYKAMSTCFNPAKTGKFMREQLHKSKQEKLKGKKKSTEVTSTRNHLCLFSF